MIIKIKEEFLELIKKENKNIIIEKINKLDYLDTKLKNGRFKIDLYKEIECLEHASFPCNLYSKCKNYLGNITINGYSIIKNPFKKDKENYNKAGDKKIPCMFISNIGSFCSEIPKLDSCKYATYTYEQYLFGKDYFKDEEEILILNIESGEE